MATVKVEWWVNGSSLFPILFIFVYIKPFTYTRLFFFKLSIIFYFFQPSHPTFWYLSSSTSGHMYVDADYNIIWVGNSPMCLLPSLMELLDKLQSVQWIMMQWLKRMNRIICYILWRDVRDVLLSTLSNVCDVLL